MVNTRQSIVTYTDSDNANKYFYDYKNMNKDEK